MQQSLAQLALPGTDAIGSADPPDIIKTPPPSVREARRCGANSHSTRYSMTVCPKCGVKCAQERGAWFRAEGTYQEVLTCKNEKCKHVYARDLLPFEIRRARIGQKRA